MAQIAYLINGQINRPFNYFLYDERDNSHVQKMLIFYTKTLYICRQLIQIDAFHVCAVQISVPHSITIVLCGSSYNLKNPKTKSRN